MISRSLNTQFGSNVLGASEGRGRFCEFEASQLCKPVPGKAPKLLRETLIQKTKKVKGGGRGRGGRRRRNRGIRKKKRRRKRKKKRKKRLLGSSVDYKQKSSWHLSDE